MAERRSFFDRFADGAEKLVSHAVFFAACVLLILLWVPLIVWLDVNTWQLIINTMTTIITFLLLALLTNTQRRFEKRTEASDKRIEALLEEIKGGNHATGTEAPRLEGSA